MLLYSEAPKFELRVQVQVPSDDDVCPMVMEKMSEYDLDFAKGMTIDANNPLLRRMQLECGHTFSAMPCLYWFAKTSLSCPLCRHGTDKPMDLKCLPAHLHETLGQKVLQKRHEDYLESELDNYRIALSMMQHDIEHDLESFTVNNNVVMVIYCFTELDDVSPLLNIPFDMNAHASGHEIRFSLSRSQIREASREFQAVGGLKSVELAIGMRSATNDIIVLDRSSRIQIPSHSGIIFGQHLGQFIFNTLVSDWPSDISVSEISWYTTPDNMNARINEVHQINNLHGDFHI